MSDRVPDEPLFDAGERFEVRRQLGAGGMGVVYEAYDRELQELVALKTLRDADGVWLTRFKQEFRSLHDLAHRNLVAFGEFFDGPTEPFFSMELVEGRSLAHWIEGHRQAGTAPSPAMALRVFGDAAAALQVGHGMPAPGVVHGGSSAGP